MGIKFDKTTAVPPTASTDSLNHTKVCISIFDCKNRTDVLSSSGVLKPGEMCLVLGCPGSGCTSFLKAIANQRDEFFSVAGDVKYAGLDAAEMAKYYKGEVVYNQEGTLLYNSIDAMLIEPRRRYSHRHSNGCPDASVRVVNEVPWP